MPKKDKIKLSELISLVENKIGKKIILKENHFLDEDDESLSYLMKKYKLDEDNFWEELQNKNKEYKFTQGLSKIFDEIYGKFFISGYDKEYGEPNITPLYKKVVGNSYKQLDIGRKIWKYIVDTNPSVLQNFMKQYIK